MSSYQTSPKDPRATVILTLDATPQVPAGVTLTGIVAIDITLVTGAETPPTLQYVNPIINSSPITVKNSLGGTTTIGANLAVQMGISGGTDGFWYQVSVTCSTTNAEVVPVLKAIIPVTSLVANLVPPVLPTAPGYSGTVGQTVFTVQDLIDEGARMAGKLASELSAEQVISAKQKLFMLLSSLINKGVQYFAIKKQVIGLLANQQNYTLPSGANDVLNALYRWMQRPIGIYTSSAGGTVANAFDNDTTTYCQQTAPNGNILIDFGAGNTEYIGSIGLMPYIAGGGSASWTFSYEASADGTNWTTIGAFSAETVTDGQWLWLDIDPGQNVRYYRIVASGGTTLGIRELFLGTFSTEITMSRLNRDDYTNLPNKNFTSDQPYQFWFDRTIPVPTIVMWPVPSQSFVQLVVWYSSQLEDIGDLNGQLAIPDRWLLAIQTMIAHQMALALPGVELQRIMLLKQEAAEHFQAAEMEERDRSPIYLAPNIGVYTQ